VTAVTVWLPEPDAVEVMGGLPEGMRADIWTGGEPLPASAGEVSVVVPPFAEARPNLALLARLPNLRLIQLMSAGAERVLPYVPPGVTLCNARGAHDPAVAEWIIGVIIAQLRTLPTFVEAQRLGKWDSVTGESLAGKTVLIVGYGSIGEALEARLSGFGVLVERIAREPRAGVGGLGDLPSALSRTDIVVLLVPVTPDTVGLVDAAFLARMRDHALLVNAARGAIVDTAALLAELKSGRLRAALDVTDPEPLPSGDPLWSAPGLLLTPHIGGAVFEARPRAYAIVREQLVRFAAGQPLKNVIGAPGY
jgi:phosphoglycerate dehydrogenase-like enzyme